MIKIQEIWGNYGVCYIGDCIEGLKQLKTQKKRVPYNITDPPYYNTGSKRVSGLNDSNKPRTVELYTNNLSEKDYFIWMQSWFDLNISLSDYIIFTCGIENSWWWQYQYPSFRSQYGIWYFPNSSDRGKISKFLQFEPILFWGDYRQNKPLDHNIFYIPEVYYVPLHNGFMSKSEFKSKLVNPDPSYKVIHPHPKPYELCELFVLKYKPESIMDTFAGSGSYIRVFEMYHIPWIAYELNPAFIPDIEWNIKVGKANPRHFSNWMTMQRFLNVSKKEKDD